MTVNGKASANGKPLVGELERTAQRWPLAAAAKVDKFVRREVQHAAEIQSRRVLAAAQAELCNRALARFIELCYDETESGTLANLGVGGVVLLPTPWSRTRHASYGLTDHGARLLRLLLLQQLDRQPPPRQLLVYGAGRWVINLRRYPHLAAAQTWLAATQITPDAWLRANDGLPRRGRKGGRKDG